MSLLHSSFISALELVGRKDRVLRKSVSLEETKWKTPRQSSLPKIFIMPEFFTNCQNFHLSEIESKLIKILYLKYNHLEKTRLLLNVSQSQSFEHYN